MQRLYMVDRRLFTFAPVGGVTITANIPHFTNTH
jgi:hypothetical protein